MVGIQVTGQIWRSSYTDDVVGGAVPSGTVLYSPVYARIAPNKSTLALLEQGLETPSIFSAIFQPQVELRQNDQFQVTAPSTSHYLNQKFRILSVQRSSMEDARRKHMVVTMRRMEIANANDLQ